MCTVATLLGVPDSAFLLLSTVTTGNNGQWEKTQQSSGDTLLIHLEVLNNGSQVLQESYCQSGKYSASSITEYSCLDSAIQAQQI